ncbi:AI-2E family transporter [Aureliella helgolandensis]|uniref:AI-2 transport protein TqsA n=1 Tax=Aureliella helgolandensis TaxID=2527968 RepID=A0A518GFR5_9BACT|nr:AI-2E family transporter [Aureliella helgolandensis]QDV27441.1 AI-2 transport protein TqsA [Aureliella helgolandensis]
MGSPKSDMATISMVARLLAAILTVAALFFARDVFIPLALGLLLSFLLSPIVNRLQRHGIPNVMAVATTAALAFVLLAVGFTLLGRELTTLLGDLPRHKGELVAKARSVSGMTSGMGGSLDELATEVSEAMDPESEGTIQEEAERTVLQRWTNQIFPAPKTSKEELPHDGTSVKAPLYVQEVQGDIPLVSWASTAGTVLGPLATAGLVSVFALFMLVHREDLRDRIIAVISQGNYVTTTEALDEAAARISRYLIAQTIVNASYGIVLIVGLVVIGATLTEGGGFPNVILWGVLATCLRFVPYVGPTVAAIFPLGIALSVFPGYTVFLAVLALIVVMELLSNNVLEPWLYGTSSGISAVAVIMAAVFWGWLWGPVGLLLSTPLTVCLVVLGRYVPSFKFLATLLGETVEIKPSIRFYQRLLANDLHRSREMLQLKLKDSSFDVLCDQILIPTLKKIRSDHDGEYLSDADADRLFALVDSLIAELSEQATEPDEVANLPLVVGCTAHHFSESLVLKLLRSSGSGCFELDSIEESMLPQEVGQFMLEHNPVAVVLTVVPRGGFVQARYFSKSIRTAGYRGPIIVCCLGKFKNFDKLFVKFRKAGATSLTTTFSQTRSKIESLVKQSTPAVVPSERNLPELLEH